MKKKLKHLLWIKLAFVSLLFCSISLLTAKTTAGVDIIKAKNDSRNNLLNNLKSHNSYKLIFIVKNRVVVFLSAYFILPQAYFKK